MYNNNYYILHNYDVTEFNESVNYMINHDLEEGASTNVLEKYLYEELVPALLAVPVDENDEMNNQNLAAINVDNNNKGTNNIPQIPTKDPLEVMEDPNNYSPQENQDYERSIEPFKKYILLTQCSALNNYLEKHNIKCESFDLLVKYGYSLSYRSLIRLVSTILIGLKKDVLKVIKNSGLMPTNLAI